MAQTSPSAPSASPPVALDRRARQAVVGAVIMALFLASLDQTIVGPALPRIVTDLHGNDVYSWVVTAYLLTSTIAVPVYGKLSDVYGRRPLLLTGIGIFLVGSALSGLSQSIDELIAFRALQGLGAGSLFPISLAIIGDLFSARERGRYQGLFGGVFGVSFLIGPLLGGVLTDSVSWHWIFYVNLPLGLAALMVIATVLPNTRRVGTRVRDLDFVGVILFAAAVVPLLLALNNKGTTRSDGTLPAWLSLEVGGLLLVSAVVAVTFVLVESRAREPIVPLSLFRDRTFSASIVATMAIAFSIFSATIYLPRYYQVVRGVGATESGYEVWPLLLGLIGGSIISGRLISRTGRYRKLIIGAATMMLIGMLLLTRLRADTDTLVLWAFMLIAGIGVGPGQSAYTTVIQNVVPRSMLGAGTSTLTFFRQIGASVGLAIAGTVFNQRFASRLPGELQSAGVPVPVAQQIANSGSRTDLTGVGAVSQSLPPSQRGLASVIATGVHNAFALATADIFWVSAGGAVIGMIAVLLIREVPFRTGPNEAPEPVAELARVTPPGTSAVVPARS